MKNTSALFFKYAIEALLLQKILFLEKYEKIKKQRIRKA